MTRRTIFLILAIYGSTDLPAQPLLKKDKQEVQQAVIRMFEDLSKRDSVRLKADCTPDVTFFEYGQTWNIDSLINKAITSNTAADFKRVNTFDFIYTEVGKSTAWATYYLSSVVSKGNKETIIQWLETAVLRKQNNQWKVTHLHSTLLKKS